MKKTLAAVLAAAMALSTTTVAFATDHPDLDSNLDGKKGGDLETPIAYDDEQKLTVSQIGPFSESDLGAYYDDNKIDITAIMTDGANKLTGRPSFSVKKVIVEGGQTETDVSYVWNTNIKVNDANGKSHTVCTAGKKVDKIPVFYDTNTQAWSFITYGSYEDLQWLENSGTMKTAYAWFLNNLSTGTGAVIDQNSKDLIHTGGTSSKAVQMKFKVAHTYGTGDTTVKMKLRVTIKKDIKDEDGTVIYKKGDTYTTDEFSYKAKYYDMDYSKDMQLSLDEVDDSKVKLDGEKLYDEIGSDTFTITFEDVAVFEAKLSGSQKKLNLFYNLDEVTSVTDAYPDVNFEFITFKGAPSVTRFINSGKMTFNAIGGRNTQVYRLTTQGGGDDGDTLVPLAGEYESTYGTITVKGIKDLSGTFVIASEILEVEDDEDNEPVNSAPVVEDSSSSEAPSNGNERNPSTGAC